MQSTYVACGIVADERKRVPHQPYTKRNPVIWPRVSICGRGEHKLSISPRSKVHQRDQVREEASYMPNQEKALKLRQPLRETNVHDDTEHDDAPVDQRTMPRLVFLEIIWIVEDCQRLDHGSSKVRRRRCGELPPPECDPSEDPTDDSVVLFWRQLGRPAILRCRCWRHGCILSERSAGAKSSDEAEKEAVYERNLDDPAGQSQGLLGYHTVWANHTGPPLVRTVVNVTEYASPGCEC